MSQKAKFIAACLLMLAWLAVGIYTDLTNPADTEKSQPN